MIEPIPNKSGSQEGLFEQAGSFLNYLNEKKRQSGVCPTQADLIHYYQGVLPKEHGKAIASHLFVCQPCQKTALTFAEAGIRPRPKRITSLSVVVLVFALGFMVPLLMRPDHQANVSFVRLEPVSQVYRNEVPVQVVAHDPEQRLILQFNTDDLADYNRYSVELLDGAQERVIWRDDTLQRQPDRSFVLDIPARYRHGTLHLRLRGEDAILADYHLHLSEP